MTSHVGSSFIYYIPILSTEPRQSRVRSLSPDLGFYNALELDDNRLPDFCQPHYRLFCSYFIPILFFVQNQRHTTRKLEFFFILFYFYPVCISSLSTIQNRDRVLASSSSFFTLYIHSTMELYSMYMHS